MVKISLSDVSSEEIRDRFLFHLESEYAKEVKDATRLDLYNSFVYTVRDLLIKKWMKTKQTYIEENVKMVNYISMEFLMGRALTNSLINLGIYNSSTKALMDLGLELENIETVEWDAALGNGGLGRLAACFLDSLATRAYPAYGYGIRYEYGIFLQKIKDGHQIEAPDNWLRYGNPWEIARPEIIYLIPFYGEANIAVDKHGNHKYRWQAKQTVMAMAYDYMIPGYDNNTANTMRLWAAKSTREFDLDEFNKGDYIRAIEYKAETENISKVLYPNDMTSKGKELRLKQEFFFTSATLQDIIRRFKINNTDLHKLPEKQVIQLNDTHPAIGIAEMMRLFLDEEDLGWEESWEITKKCFAYTNHTVMPEALEKWSIDLMAKVLPRHLQIIYEIDRRFVESISETYADHPEKIDNMSIVGDEMIRMANLAVIGSSYVNGVAELHTEIIKDKIFNNFYELYPDKFQNKTNGITQRRWLLKCNPKLSDLISENIGEQWTTQLDELKDIEQYQDDPSFIKRWQDIKLSNKKRLAKFIKEKFDHDVNVNSIFDVQVKRIHEYKRQLMNLLHVVYLYVKLKDDPNMDFVPRTFIIAGKAAPGYYLAKCVIKLINDVAEVINNDERVNEKLKLLFLPNYNVSMAELIIPATDLSEQISTAGMEASGTGNMKFSLNGALTIGTLDGANIEIKEEVGDENIFIFGLTDKEIEDQSHSYNPVEVYNDNEDIRHIINLISDGFFTKNKTESDHVRSIIDSLLNRGDQYFVLADLAAYIKCQEDVAQEYLDQDKWTKKAIINVANMGKFSSDRTIDQYASEIWGLKKTNINL